MVAELSANTRFEAVAQPATPEAADAAATQPKLTSNGDTPAFSPSLPHATTSERLIAAKAHFKNFIKVSLDFWLGLAGVNGRPSGR